MADEDEKVRRGHCPNCGPRRLSDVRGHHQDASDDRETGMWGHVDHYILVCRGCETTFIQKSSVCSEDVDHRQNRDGEWEQFLDPTIEHWPAPSKRSEPSWAWEIHFLGDPIGGLFADVYGCLNAGLIVPAVVATRTAFDSATEYLGIDPGKPFAAKLDELLTLGKISKDEREVLEVLVDAGSAAAHRGWRPSTSELQTLVSLLESFFHRTFVLGEEAKKLKASIPARQKAGRK